MSPDSFDTVPNAAPLRGTVPTKDQVQGFEHLVDYMYINGSYTGSPVYFGGAHVTVPHLKKKEESITPGQTSTTSQIGVEPYTGKPFSCCIGLLGVGGIASDAVTLTFVMQG